MRFGETLKSYMASPTLDPATLTAIPLALAGWLRYLLALAQVNNAFAARADAVVRVVCGIPVYYLSLIHI